MMKNGVYKSVLCWTVVCTHPVTVMISPLQHSLPELNLPNMKTASFVAPEPNRLSCACATSWRRKTLIFTFEWTGESLKPIAFPWKCHWKHIMEHCDEYNNCSKFQFYAEKVGRDIQFFVILHHFKATLWRHKSSNLHKSKSWITRQPTVLS